MLSLSYERQPYTCSFCVCTCTRTCAPRGMPFGLQRRGHLGGRRDERMPWYPTGRLNSNNSLLHNALPFAKSCQASRGLGEQPRDQQVVTQEENQASPLNPGMHVHILIFTAILLSNSDTTNNRKRLKHKLSRARARPEDELPELPVLPPRTRVCPL